MYSVAVTSPGKVEIVEVGLPKVGEYDVLVKTEISFICNATDNKVINYHMPGLNPEDYPLLLGHEAVGRVVGVGNKVKNFRVGDRAIGGLLFDVDGPYGSGWGGHSEFTLIKDIYAMLDDGAAPENYNETYKIMTVVPDDIPIEAAGLLCTWREVYSGFFNDFKATPDKDIIIFGSGPIGLSFARFAKIKGFRKVVVVDPLPNKREMAKKMGAHFVLDPSEISKHVEDHGKADMVIDAVGHPSIINSALSLIKLNGSICVFGVVGKETFELEKFRGPFNFNLLFHQWPTRDYERAAQKPLVEWIRNGLLDYRDFVTSTFSVNDVALAVEEVKKPTNVKTMLVFDR